MNTIQFKVTRILVIALMIAFGLSSLSSMLLTSSLLSDSAIKSQKALRQATFDQARSIFSTLEIGTHTSVEQGEMEIFQSLLEDLGNVPGVMEIGMSNSAGKIDYSNQKNRVGQQIGATIFQKVLKKKGENQEFSDQNSILLLKGKHLQESCLDCHDDRKAGDLAGVLYVRYSLSELQAAEAEAEETLSRARLINLISTSLVGILALLATSVMIYLFLGKYVRKPLERVVQMMQELGKGHLNERLGLTQEDEIGRMARSMDAFADSLQNEIVRALQLLARGDLTIRVDAYDEDDIVRGSLNKLGNDLNSIITQILVSADELSAVSHQVADASSFLSEGATESAASLEEISSTMTEIGSQSNESAKNAIQANQFVGEAQNAATAGTQKMETMVNAMTEINESGQNINKIIKVIEEIAFQTNLLALNASVEAARAGQYGKGFAVVAEEVRNLAARSAAAAEETTELIEGSVNKANHGTRIADETATALTEIVESITKVNQLVSQISTANNEQANGISEVNTGLQQIDQVVQRNTSTSEESAATAEQLSSQATELKNQLSRFILKDRWISPEKERISN